MPTLLRHQSNADDNFFFDSAVCFQTMHDYPFSLSFLVNEKQISIFANCRFSISIMHMKSVYSLRANDNALTHAPISLKYD